MGESPFFKKTLFWEKKIISNFCLPPTRAQVPNNFTVIQKRIHWQLLYTRQLERRIPGSSFNHLPRGLGTSFTFSVFSLKKNNYILPPRILQSHYANQMRNSHMAKSEFFLVPPDPGDFPSLPHPGKQQPAVMPLIRTNHGSHIGPFHSLPENRQSILLSFCPFHSQCILHPVHFAGHQTHHPCSCLRLKTLLLSGMIFLDFMQVPTQYHVREAFPYYPAWDALLFHSHIVSNLLHFPSEHLLLSEMMLCLGCLSLPSLQTHQEIRISVFPSRCAHSSAWLTAGHSINICGMNE